MEKVRKRFDTEAAYYLYVKNIRVEKVRKRFDTEAAYYLYVKNIRTEEACQRPDGEYQNSLFRQVSLNEPLNASADNRVLTCTCTLPFGWTSK